MAKYTLNSTSPLQGYARQFGSTSLVEECNLSIYSVSFAADVDTALASIRSALGVEMPAPGKSITSKDGQFHLLGLQQDQLFIIDRTTNQQLPEFENAIYTTDQSDSWAALSLTGPMATAALERICPIDLHPSVFSSGSVARTSMEHLAVIILRESNKQFLLLSPTSSANSFLHAVETALHNVHG